MDEQIDANLRRVYRETLNQPVPDRFQKLIDQLREEKNDRRSDKAEVSSEDEE